MLRRGEFDGCCGGFDQCTVSAHRVSDAYFVVCFRGHSFSRS